MANTSGTEPSLIDFVQLQQSFNSAINNRKTLQEQISAQKNQIEKLQEEYLKKQSGVLKLFTRQNTIDNLAADIAEYKRNLEKLFAEFDSSKIDVDKFNEEIDSDAYNLILDAFASLSRCQKIWEITSSTTNTETKSSAGSTVSRSEVHFSLGELDFISSRFRAITIELANKKKFYIYPYFIVYYSAANDVRVADLNNLNFTFKAQRFIEYKNSAPSDAQIIDQVWERVNKDGTPDLRFKGNTQLPVARYGLMKLNYPDVIDAEYNISDYDGSVPFASRFGAHLIKLNRSDAGGVEAKTENQEMQEKLPRQYFDLLRDFLAEVVRLSGTLIESTALRAVAKPAVAELSTDRFIVLCIIYDFCQIIKLLNDGNYYGSDSLEALGLSVSMYPMLAPGSENPLNIGYETTALMFENNSFNEVAESIFKIGNNASPLSVNPQTNEIEQTSGRPDANGFCLPAVLNRLDHAHFDEYSALLYRFANIIVKADNVVSKKEEEKLKEIYRLLHAPIPVRKTSSLAVPKASESIEDILAELNGLTGLDAVKREINTLINFIKVQKAREASGLKSSNISYHIVFTGNPGTGKTTVARIVAKIYRALGILSQGQLIETDRAGLIGEYVGQTAVKVNKVIDSAINGVLFIDEAYSIAGGSQEDFGKEAVAAIIKRMEDDRDKLVVIMAGYTAEMKAFIETNPGFESRFNRYIEFNDYTPAELLSIFETQCSKLDYKVTDEAREKLSNNLDVVYANRNKFFGNGRYVRNVFERTLENQANRIAGIPVLTTEILTTILAEDIPQ